ncbi:tetratricopeptide repeat protein [Roseomonas sp. OT10]|uniref:tetratricopeptide repeat protein n=1 Tax=Roseomonas cutis TaxID=2897332 RepID=UPI001E56FF77|nr:tetratricopeptide repeat protein [Roseomonas sp. OT10]UFN50722.1 tetratricopeptide repeat protein [Roseomonas sp. OT10]
MTRRIIMMGRPGQPVSPTPAAAPVPRDAREARGDLLPLALDRLRAGDLVAAEPLLREVCRRRPEAAEAHRLLGTLLAIQGARPEAEAELRAACRLAPGSADAFGNLGNLLLETGRPQEAEEALRRALRLQPGYADAASNLGLALLAQGRDVEAEAAFRTALRLAPGHARAGLNLGLLLLDHGRVQEAGAPLLLACRQWPQGPEPRLALGRLARRQGRPAEAEAILRDALRLAPADADIRIELAGALAEAGRTEPAAMLYREVLDGHPEHPDAWLGLGITLATLGRFGEAEPALREALRRRPGSAEVLNSLGALSRDLGRDSEAEALLREALRLRPGYGEAETNLGFLLLQQGRFREGWTAHEARWHASPLCRERRELHAPIWDGSPLAGRTLLLHAEQGLGDTLQFCRFVPWVARSGGEILLEVPPPLIPLLADQPGMGRVLARGSPLPRFDLHLPLMSLPHRLAQWTEAAIPPAPYLCPDPARVAAWAERLAALPPGPRIGLVWAGNPAMAADRRRSLAPGLPERLGGVPGLRFVSLQKGPAGHRPALEMLDPSGDLQDFAETAALVQNLDLVIGVDTAVIHLAGAMGRPVWLLDRADHCWRWLRGREDSPWYPSLRIFRQAAPGDWAGVLDRVRQALEGLPRRLP